MSPPRVHALLAGIDRYGAGGFEDLDGAVRDARRIEAYLHGEMGLPRADIELLTASRGLSSEPPEPLVARAGYHQLIAGFRRIRDRSAPGDLAFFYFSGHGARLPSLLAERSPGFDEGLVPYDALQPGSRALHDLELAFLLAELAARGVETVVVLDACFAGGALRAEPRVRARGRTPGAAFAPERTPSAVASREELRAFLAGQEGRDSSRWRPGSPRHTFLAACAAHELALEAPLEEGGVGGVFTAALLAALRRSSPSGASYRQILARVRASLVIAGSHQTPHAEGELDRAFLGREPAATLRGVAVLGLHEDGSVELAAGALQGLSQGALFRPLTAGPEGTVLEATAVEEQSCRAQPIPTGAPAAIEPGDFVSVLSPAPWRLLRRVQLVGAAAEIPGLAERLERPPLTDERFVRRAQPAETADFRVEIASSTRIEVLTALGEVLSLGPSLSPDQPGAADELVRRLTHLSRFEALRRLRNRDSTSRLHEALELEIDGERVAATGRLDAGVPFTLAARNRSDQVLYVTLFSLGTDWSVERLWPQGLWASLAPGQSTPRLEAAVDLPAGVETARTVLKAFASEAPASFDWLELPALLVTQPEPGRIYRAPASPLEEFLAAWQAGRVTGREVLRSTADDWTTVQWEARVRRSPHRGSSG